MNKQTRFSEKFKFEAAKQLTERSHGKEEVAAWLYVSQYRLYARINRNCKTPEVRIACDSQVDEMR